jgi:hypothetical protein
MEEVNEPAWVDALSRSYSHLLTFVTEVLGCRPEVWQSEALAAVAQNDRVSIRSGGRVGWGPSAHG